MEDQRPMDDVTETMVEDSDTERAAKFVVFDTETTGLFLFRDKDTGEPVPADDPRQPRMASFAFILTDETGSEISRGKHFVKPDGWSIDGTKAGEVNGLTDEFLTENGDPVSVVLDLWEGFVEQGLIAAAFNSQFDCKMMRAELRRAGRDQLFEQTRNTCVMRALSAYKDEGLAVKRGMVSLANACEFFEITNENAHDAMSDAEAALGILKRLIVDGRVQEPKVHYAKGSAS